MFTRIMYTDIMYIYMYNEYKYICVCLCVCVCVCIEVKKFHHEKAFRSDLFTQIKKGLLRQITYYSCYLFVLGNFIRFFPWLFLFFWVSVLIGHSAFLLCTIFKPNWNRLIIIIIIIIIIMTNITITDISTEIINSENTKLIINLNLHLSFN